MRKLLFALFIPLLLTVGCKKDEVVEPDYAKEIEGFYVAETQEYNGKETSIDTRFSNVVFQVAYLDKNSIYFAEFIDDGVTKTELLRGKATVSKISGLYQFYPNSENNKFENLKVQIGTNNFYYERYFSSKATYKEQIGIKVAYRGKKY